MKATSLNSLKIIKKSPITEYSVLHCRGASDPQQRPHYTEINSNLHRINPIAENQKCYRIKVISATCKCRKHPAICRYSKAPEIYSNRGEQHRIRGHTAAKNPNSMAMPKTSHRNGSTSGGSLIPMALAKVFGAEDDVMEIDSPAQSLKKLLAEKAKMPPKGAASGKRSRDPTVTPPHLPSPPKSGPSHGTHFRTAT